MKVRTMTTHRQKRETTGTSSTQPDPAQAKELQANHGTAIKQTAFLMVHATTDGATGSLHVAQTIYGDPNCAAYKLIQNMLQAFAAAQQVDNNEIKKEKKPAAEQRPQPDSDKEK